MESSSSVLNLPLESVMKVYVLSKTVQKSFILRSVLLSGSSTMEDVWTTPLT